MTAYFLDKTRIESLIALLRNEGAILSAETAAFLCEELPPALRVGQFKGIEALEVPLGGEFGESCVLSISAEKVCLIQGDRGKKKLRAIKEINEQIRGIAYAPQEKHCDCPKCLWDRCHFCGKTPAPREIRMAHKTIARACHQEVFHG